VSRRPGRGGPAGIALTLLLSWLVLYPIVLLVLDGLHGDAVRTFVTRSGEWHALWASVWISLASVAVAALVGVPLAFLFEWFEFPGRKLLGAFIALPAVLPPFVGVIAFHLLPEMFAHQRVSIQFIGRVMALFSNEFVFA